MLKMTDEYIIVSFEKLEAFWSDMKVPNFWVQKLCTSFDRYPDSNFGAWLFKNKSRKRMVVADFLSFELRIKGREANKKTNHRINAMADRLTRKSVQKFNILLYSQQQSLN